MTVWVVIQEIPYEGFREPVCVCATQQQAEQQLAVIARATYEHGYQVIEVPWMPNSAGA